MIPRTLHDNYSSSRDVLQDKILQDKLKSETPGSPLNSMYVIKSSSKSAYIKQGAIEAAKNMSAFEEYLSSEYPDIYERFSQCGSKVMGVACESCDKRYFVPVSCGVRGCPTCGGHYLRRLLSRYIPALKRQPQHAIKKVVLTYGHLDEITHDRLSEIYRDFQRVLNRFWKTYVCGLEISPGGSIHVHAIVVGQYVSHKRLSKESFSVFGRPICHISRGDNLRYMMKDVCKQPDFKSDTLRIQYFEATRHLRMFRSRGGLYNTGTEDSVFQCHVCGGSLFFESILDLKEVSSFPFCVLYSRWSREPPPIDSLMSDCMPVELLGITPVYYLEK
jgi:hypothetical protein